MSLLNEPVPHWVLLATPPDSVTTAVPVTNPAFGVTVHDEREAAVNALMARRAERAILIADSSKIGRRAFATVGLLSDFTTLITDDGITQGDRAAFESAGIEVVVAS